VRANAVEQETNFERETPPGKIMKPLPGRNVRNLKNEFEFLAGKVYNVTFTWFLV